ncbi:MAG TPA: divalent-cation tolerance protein CutA [Polyangiaceae bacterium]
MQPKAIVVLCTAPDRAVAERLARGVVEARLAACVNLVPDVRSIYRWQGELHDEAEVQLVIKTRIDRFDALEAWLKEHHPYEVPEVIGLSAVAVSMPYLSWIEAETTLA